MSLRSIKEVKKYPTPHGEIDFIPFGATVLEIV